MTSNSFTSLPRRAKPEAISAPEAPAPTTVRRAGRSVSAQASSVPITPPPNSTPGIERLTEPVARITVVAVNSRSPTRTRAGIAFCASHPLGPDSVPGCDASRSPARAHSDASPSIRSIEFFLNRPATPPVSVETTFSRRPCTAA